jgi:hypothetical protein
MAVGSNRQSRRRAECRLIAGAMVLVNSGCARNGGITGHVHAGVRVGGMKAGARAMNFRFVAVLGLLLASAAVCSAATETYYFFVFSNPVAGHEDEYNKWYNEQHAPDVVAVPGFVTAQRFVKNDLPLYRMVEVQVPKYLVVHKIVTNDVEAVFSEVSRQLKTGETVISPTFDSSTSVRSWRPSLVLSARSE